MQSVNELWRTLRALPDTEIEWRFDINGVTYGPENEVSHDANHALFSEFGFGNATCGGLNLQLYADNIPKGAEIKRFCRLVNGAQVSEWLPMGVYYINRRSEEDGYWEIEAFDNMRKAEKVWEPDQSLTFPMPMDEAVTEICRVLGFTLDSRTTLSHAYTLDYPESEQTYRRTLQMIAAAHGGNFVFTGEGKLRLVPLISLPEESFYLVDQNGNPITFGGQRITVGDGESANSFDPNGVKHLVGLDLFSIRDNGKSKPVSRVTLLADNENTYTAGDDTGMELVADCAYATQEMVNALLSTFKGFVYQAFEADGANLDPAAELGDGITAGGLYSILGELNENGSGYPDIAAPGKEELEDEYPSQGPVTQQFNRKLAQTRSLISKTAEEIRLEVAGVEDEISYIQLDLESITSRVQDAEGNISTLEQTATSLRSEISGKLDGDEAQSLIDQTLEGIELSVSSSGGSTTFKLTADGVLLSTKTLDLTVDAVNISGTLTAGALRGGTVGLLTNREALAGGIDITGASSSGFAIELYSEGALRLEAYDGALYLGSDSASMEISNYIWCNDHIFPSDPEAYDCGNNNYPWAMVSTVDLYVDGAAVTSDRNKKHDIFYGLDAYDALFDALRAVGYKLNNGKSDRVHIGMIAQDVEEALLLCGLTNQDFAAVVREIAEDGTERYFLRYMEFIGLLIDQVQKLKARVARLEGEKNAV